MKGFNSKNFLRPDNSPFKRESQRETSSMERNIGRAQTTEVVNAIKSAPVLLTENSMAHIRTSHSAMNEVLCNGAFVYSPVRVYDSTLSVQNQPTALTIEAVRDVTRFADARHIFRVPQKLSADYSLIPFRSAHLHSISRSMPRTIHYPNKWEDIQSVRQIPLTK